MKLYYNTLCYAMLIHIFCISLAENLQSSPSSYVIFFSSLYLSVSFFSLFPLGFSLFISLSYSLPSLMRSLSRLSISLSPTSSLPLLLAFPFSIIISLVSGSWFLIRLIILPSSAFSFRSEFKIVTGGGRLMRLDMLLDWKEIKELLEDGVITQKQVG